MPEGHTIHRYARLHARALRGEVVGVTSPQGRFAEGAAHLDGSTVTGVDPYGKHLFYRFAGRDRGEATLHVHLGLFGRFWRHRAGSEPPPTAGTRLEIRTPEAVLRLAGPTACDLMDPAAEESLRARLGPDPLRRDFDPDEVAARVSRRRAPIGQVLLDQKVISGIGNVYRAEALFACGIHPDVPANELAAGEVARLCEVVVGMLRRGERAGRIVTVEPADVGVERIADIPVAERLCVYKRSGSPCRRCDSTILAWELGARLMFACPSCQPRRRRAR